MRSKGFKISFLLIAILTMPLYSLAADGFKGDAFYAKGQYKEAIASYEAIIDQGKHSAALYYNLGNAYFKSGEIAPAIWYYEKARLLSPGDEDINFNIRFANTKTVDKIDETPEFFLTKWWTAYILHFSADTWSIIAVALLFFASGLLILYFFSLKIAVKKVAFFTAIGLYVIGLFTIFTAQSQVSYFKDNQQAIIFASVATVKSSPSAKAATAFVLHEGTKVNLKESNGDFIRIKLANGNEGWINALDIRKI